MKKKPRVSIVPYLCLVLVASCGIALGACTHLPSVSTAAMANTPPPSAPLATATRGGAELRIRAVTSGTEAAPVKTPAPGKVPVLTVDIQLVNVGRMGVPFSGSYFTVMDTQGNEYAPVVIATSRLATGTLERGEEVHGTLSFACDPGLRGLILRYDPLRFAQAHDMHVDEDARAVSPLLAPLGP